MVTDIPVMDSNLPVAIYAASCRLRLLFDALQFILGATVATICCCCIFYKLLSLKQTVDSSYFLPLRLNIEIDNLKQKKKTDVKLRRAFCVMKK